MANETKDWMDKLVKNYRIPDEQPKEKKEPVRLLKESQLRIKSIVKLKTNQSENI
jgi:hypothetical protein